MNNTLKLCRPDPLVTIRTSVLRVKSLQVGKAKLAGTIGSLLLFFTFSAWSTAGETITKPGFEDWAEIAKASTQSPVEAEKGDLTKRWKAPDGREISLVVKRPRLRPDAPTVTMKKVASGEDARPAFDAAVKEAKEKGASRLVIPAGTYVFRSFPRPESGHAIIDGLTDLTIDGKDATFVFTQNEPGVLISRCKRLAITGLKLFYDLRTTSFGTIEKREQGNVLVIDPSNPVSASDPVYYVSEYDHNAKLWTAAGQRVILPPGARNPAEYIGQQTYRSSEFSAIKPGTTVTAFHYWYGPAAIKINDVRGPSQNEDIVVDGITIHGTPGFAIYAYGFNRGLAIVNSTISADPKGRNPASSIYDAIRIVVGGGDVIIAKNRIANQGDDAINLDSPIHPIVSFDIESKTLRLSKYSRFISSGDALVFFDNKGQIVGMSKVTAPPRPLGGLDNEITVDSIPAGLQKTDVVRDPTLMGSRFDISDNLIEDCKCHGMLLQWPNGMVERNTIRNTSANAIRLLTDVGRWNEGVGAFNVILRKNVITNSGIDTAPMVPWSAITVYGGTAKGAASEPTNGDIEIADNTITAPKQGCITVASSKRVKLLRNSCTDSNRSDPRQPSISILKSSSVELSGNRRNEKSGHLSIDATTSSAVDLKGAY